MTDQNFVCPGTCADISAAFNNGFRAGFYATLAISRFEMLRKI